MKPLLISALTAALAITTAGAQTVVAPVPGTATMTTQTTTSYTISDGIVDVWEPDTRLILREESGPVTYAYGPQTIYATPGGVVLSAEQVRTRVRAGLPVRVEYTPQGDQRLIRRIVIRGN